MFKIKDSLNLHMRNTILFMAGFLLGTVHFDHTDNSPATYYLYIVDECKDYKCKNNRCIPYDINCNGKDTCGDQSDCLKEEKGILIMFVSSTK